jgi:hypothetical protein
MTIRWILASAIIVIAITTLSAAMAKTSQLRIVAELPGSSLKWIHIAEGEFERKGLDLDKYTVLVVEEKSSVVVILRGLNAPRSARGKGNEGPDPGYAVEISKKDLKVVRSNYVR